jgi:hypothetical protein
VLETYREELLGGRVPWKIKSSSTCSGRHHITWTEGINHKHLGRWLRGQWLKLCRQKGWMDSNQIASLLTYKILKIQIRNGTWKILEAITRYLSEILQNNSLVNSLLRQQNLNLRRNSSSSYLTHSNNSKPSNSNYILSDQQLSHPSSSEL